MEKTQILENIRAVRREMAEAEKQAGRAIGSTLLLAATKTVSAEDINFAVNEGYIVRNGKICEAVRGASLIGTGSDILQDIDMVGQNLATGQGMCGSSSGSVPTDVGQPLIRVSKITVGGR